MPIPQPQLEVGSYYGKYFLLKKLAAGGMGEIFLAKQQGPAGFEKILVVKKVLPHLTENKEFVELFLSEARLAARMNHRNVVQLFELGEHQGSYFIAMEYVSGRTLRDLIDAAARKREKIPAEVCRSIAEQICDGASYAHNLTDVTGRSLNIIHRDLNPQNVLLSYTGDVKIIDFGIAKSEMSTVKTEAGMIKGKFVYMSPEQSLAKKLDKRSDIFAIGITLYEMLTSTNPFHKSNIVLTLEAVQRYDPPPPSEYDAAYAPFDPIIAKALAKDRDRRYPDAAEMLDDLRRIVVPRSPERLAQLMGRLFRQQLEEEHRLLLDTDGGRAEPGGSARPSAARTPARPAPTPIAKPESDGGTLILNPAAPPGAEGATCIRQRRRDEHPHAGRGAGGGARGDGKAAAVPAAGGAHADAAAGAGGAAAQAQRQGSVDRAWRRRSRRAGWDCGAARLAALGRAGRAASAPRNGGGRLRSAKGGSRQHVGEGCGLGTFAGGRAETPRGRAARAEETGAQAGPCREDRGGAAQDRLRQAVRHAHRQSAGRRADHLRRLRAAEADRRLQPTGHWRERHRRSG